MSSNANDLVIRRFTNDWLIRFAELHYFEPFDLPNNSNTEVLAHYSITSKYTAISPLFTHIITQYTPYLYYNFNFYVKNDKIADNKLHGLFHDFTLPTPKKWNVFISETCRIGDLTPGTVSWLAKNCVTFYSRDLRISDFAEPIINTMTTYELKYLLNSCKFDRKVEICAILTDSIAFAEVCPLVAHCKDITIDVKNMVFDGNVANVLRENQLCPNFFLLHELDLSERAFLEMLDYFLVLPVCDRVLSFKFVKRQPVSLSKAIAAKYEHAGVMFLDLILPKSPFYTCDIHTYEQNGIPWVKISMSDLPSNLRQA
uniref:F-box domain-containing protein n=1 Tax=Panagrellus redivivus TaxID=6233 RepID=A0A7E4ZYA5_PANRE